MADIAKEYIVACYRNDFNEVDRLYNEHTAICERTVFELHVWCTEAMIAFVGRHTLVPVELRNASLRATEFFSKNKEQLVDYAATFPLNRQKLLEFAVRTDNVEVASSILADPSFVVKDLDALVTQAIQSGYLVILSLLCEQLQMTPHLAKNIVYAAEQNNVVALRMLWAKYQGPPIIFWPHMFTGMTLETFCFMDTEMNAFAGNYQPWVSVTTHSNSDLLRHLVINKGVTLSGEIWVHITCWDPDLALIAVKRGQADWRECRVDDRVRLPMLREMASLRVNGFTTTDFLSFPVDLKRTLRTILFAGRRRGAIPTAVLGFLFDWIVVGYTRHVHTGPRVLSAAYRPCRKCNGPDCPYCPRCLWEFCAGHV